MTEGMEFVDQIKKGSEARNGEVEDPDSIVRMWMPRARSNERPA